MTAVSTKIVGFAPSPETAATVVAWVEALAQEGEGKIFLCYETGFDGRTEKAVREAPSGFDFRGAAKYAAWEKRRGMSADEAMQAYIDLVEQLSAG